MNGLVSTLILAGIVGVYSRPVAIMFLVCAGLFYFTVAYGQKACAPGPHLPKRFRARKKKF